MTRSHKIGWLVLAVAVLFVLWRLPRLHGQGFGSFSHDQPYLAADRASVLTRPVINYPRYLWSVDSLTYLTPGDRVLSWTDSISGVVLTNTAAQAPIYSTNGVEFYGTNCLHPQGALGIVNLGDTHSAGGTNSIFALILNHRSVLKNQMVLCGTYSGGDILIGIGNTDGHYYDGAYGGDGIPVSTGLYDLLQNYWANGQGGQIFTNGMLVAGYPNTIFEHATIQHIGTDETHRYGLDGFIKEIAYWTNRPVGYTVNDILALHTYYASKYSLTAPSSPSDLADAQVNEWSNRVVVFGGASPSAGTLTALKTFHMGLNNSNLLAKMVAVNCFVPDNLVAARIPFIRTGGGLQWTNNNFVAGDLTVSGLTGNGSSKYLNTGLLPDKIAPATPTSAGLSVMIATPASEAAVAISAMGATGSSGFLIDNWQGGAGFGCWRWEGASDVVSGTVSATYAGFLSGSRTAPNAIAAYSVNSTNAIAVLGSSAGAQTGTQFGTYPLTVFANNAAGTINAYSAATLSFAAVHAGLSQAETAALYSLVATLRASLGGGNP